MPENDDAADAGLDRTWLLAGTLITGGVLAAGAAIVWGLARVLWLARVQPFPFTDFLGAIALMFAGAALGLLLWGSGEVLRKLDGLLEGLKSLPAAPNLESGMVRGARPEVPVRGIEELRAAFEELVLLTREVRDISLLPEDQRAERLAVQGRAAMQSLQQEIPALLQDHQWVEARRRIQIARERFPHLPEWDELEKQIEQVRANVETRDVEGAARQVEDLTALGALDRAMSVVRELLDRHPNSAKAQELARRVSLQRAKADAEARARLMAQTQEAANQREWNRALGLANEMLRRFPRSVEAEALRQQLPLLTENAEIQTRQQMEAEYRELVKQHRYESALQLAQELVARYPSSPQAEALRGQIDKLEARALGR